MLYVTLLGLQESRTPSNRPYPEAWPLKRGKWEGSVAADEETVGRTPGEDCYEEITTFV